MTDKTGWEIASRAEEERADGKTVEIIVKDRVGGIAFDTINHADAQVVELQTASGDKYVFRYEALLGFSVTRSGVQYTGI